MDYPCGWVYDEEKLAAANSRLANAGCKVSLADGMPELKGFWGRLQSRGITGVFAQDDEQKLLGHWRDTNTQQRGTCVGQGMSRGAEDTHISRLVDHVIVGVYTLFAYEAMYGGERSLRWGKTHQWGCQCRNCPDGLMGADAAAWFSIQGALARGVYDQIDLSRPREDLAITWNNDGVPQLLVAASKFHRLAAHASHSWSEYSDAIAAKCFGAICLPRVFTGTKQDRYRCCEPDGDGGHCTECCGVFLLPTGETAFVIQQSWPLGAVHYSPTVQTIAGPKKLRPGSYPVRQSVLEGISASYRDRVEMHSFDIPSGSSFR